MKQKGFTLIELLVVIAIIGLLASVVFIALNSARSKARDAKRIADLNQMAKALDVFYNLYGQYPNGWGGLPTWNQNWPIFASCMETGAGCGVTTTNFTPIFSKTPQDPSNSLSNFGSPTYYYAYENTARSGCTGGQSYRLGAVLENNNQVLQSSLSGSIFNGDGICTKSAGYYPYCIGVGTCAGW